MSDTEKNNNPLGLDIATPNNKCERTPLLTAVGGAITDGRNVTKRTFENPQTTPPGYLVSFVVSLLMSPVVFFLIVISVPVNVLMWSIQIFRAPFIYRRLRSLEKDNWIHQKGSLFHQLTHKKNKAPAYGNADDHNISDRSPVIIIGAGIGGLSLAHFLLQCGFQVKVFEKHSDCGVDRGGGHGLISGRWCYDKMGLQDVFEKTCDRGHTWSFDSGRWWLTAKIRLLPNLNNNLLLPSVRFTPGAFVRSDFLQYLVTSLPPDVLYLNHDLKEIKSFNPPDSKDKGNGVSTVKAIFANDQVHLGSLIVGCDGSKSRVRDLMFRTSSSDSEKKESPTSKGGGGDPFYVDVNVWWSVTPISAISEEDRTSMEHFKWETGPHRQYFEGGAIMHLIAKDQIILVVDYRAQSLFKHHQDWAGNATNIEFMEFMKIWDVPIIYMPVAKYASRVSHFAIPKGLSREMNQWSNSFINTVLLGDAVHPTPHFFGQGANAAIQDAYCLTRFLCTSNGDLHSAFKSYVAIRKPPADHIISMSYLLGLTETAGGIPRIIRDLLFFTVVKTGLFTWPSVHIMSVRV